MTYNKNLKAIAERKKSSKGSDPCTVISNNFRN